MITDDEDIASLLRQALIFPSVHQGNGSHTAMPVDMPLVWPAMITKDGTRHAGKSVFNLCCTLEWQNAAALDWDCSMHSGLQSQRTVIHMLEKGTRTQDMEVPFEIWACSPYWIPP